MKQFSLVVLTFLTTACFGQSLEITKRQVAKLFKSSIDQESRKSISIGSGEWTICNQDSAFFKSQTLKLYSNSNYFYQIDKCCDFINWTFYRANAFVQSYSQICKEPPTHSVKHQYFKIKISNKNGRVNLAITPVLGVTQIFEVVELKIIPLAQNNTTKEITIRRL